MGVAHQLLDIAIAGILAGITTFALAAVAPRSATEIGVLIATLYYFSRNPWGGDGAEINAAIDEAYATIIPGR